MSDFTQYYVWGIYLCCCVSVVYTFSLHNIPLYVQNILLLINAWFVAMNIPVHLLWCIYIFISMEYILRSRIAGSLPLHVYFNMNI